VLRHRQPLTTAITPRSIGRRCGRSPGPGSAVRHERPARRAHRLPDHPAHALGYKLERTEKLLCQFLDYLDEHELERVTTGRRSAWTAPTSTSTTASSPCARASSASRGSCRCTPRLWRRSTATSAAAIGCARRQRAKPCSSLRLVERAGLRPRPASCRPRLHDLRHSFAVRTVLDWYRAGVDVQARLRLLSTYLGPRRPGGDLLVPLGRSRAAHPRRRAPRARARGRS
jgi:hypothetical protein